MAKDSQRPGVLDKKNGKEVTRLQVRNKTRMIDFEVDIKKDSQLPGQERERHGSSNPRDTVSTLGLDAMRTCSLFASVEPPILERVNMDHACGEQR